LPSSAATSAAKSAAVAAPAASRRVISADASAISVQCRLKPSWNAPPW
jgi:hypothetical protein